MSDYTKTESKEPPPIIRMGGGGMGKGHGGGGRFSRPVEKPKDAKKTIIRLLSFFKGQYSAIAVTLALVIVTSACSILSPLLSGNAIDALNDRADASVLYKILVFLTFVYLANAAGRFFQSWVTTGIAQKTVKIIRKALFDKMQKLPVSFFDSYPHGELMSRITNDTDNIAVILGTAITQLMSIFIVLFGCFAMMITLSPAMTFFSLVTMPVIFLLTQSIAKRTRVLFKEQQAALGRLNACIEENISGIDVVKAYSHEKYAVSEFHEINESLRNISTKSQILSGYIMPLMNIINNMSFAVVAGAGGYFALKGHITVGAIAIFINYSRQFGRPLNEIAALYNQIQQALASAERVFDIFDAQPEPSDSDNAEDLKRAEGSVEFKNVNFWYYENEPVLKNISFKTEKGSTIALVGPTGAGKTTVVNLIARFYDACGGEILLDGRNIEAYKRDTLRKAFGIVLQDTYLFSGTIGENICYGNESATNEEMLFAAKSAGAHDFIIRLPEGYDTMLTESGQNLSEGQKQLIAISRAILFNPDILILDEATSSVDTRTEIKIQKAFKSLMKNRTSFVIAHRLSTIMDADKIMFIDDGKVKESGTHAELIALGGRYKKMYDIQAMGRY